MHSRRFQLGGSSLFHPIRECGSGSSPYYRWATRPNRKTNASRSPTDLSRFTQIRRCARFIRLYPLCPERLARFARVRCRYLCRFVSLWWRAYIDRSHGRRCARSDTQSLHKSNAWRHRHGLRGCAKLATLEELLAFLRCVDSAVLEHQGRLARSWYERFHREETLRLALSQSCQIVAPSLRADYRADVLVQALRNSREVTLRGVFYRMTWRYYRRWQARLGRLS